MDSVVNEAGAETRRYADTGALCALVFPVFSRFAHELKYACCQQVDVVAEAQLPAAMVISSNTLI